jgi:hypothetical protein
MSTGSGSGIYRKRCPGRSVPTHSLEGAAPLVAKLKLTARGNVHDHPDSVDNRRRSSGPASMAASSSPRAGACRRRLTRLASIILMIDRAIVVARSGARVGGVIPEERGAAEVAA